MLGQTFDPIDIVRLVTLAFIELLLSSDNAIVLALLAHGLPEKLRKRALFIGLASSFFLRAAALLTVSYLLRYKWLQLLGAAYLIYVAIHHFLKKPKNPHQVLAHPSFWMTVLKIELFDIAFAIDSIIAGIVFISNGQSTSSIHPKLWIVYAGGMIGLIGIRYAAGLFGSLLQRFPRLETSAYLMVGWIGLKLALSTFHLPYLAPIFWAGLLVLFLLGLRQPKS